ncbi:MAG: FimV/HubP family polar landmark protein, partial [Thiotrichaceae bacterium]|nr:FimV/HubP family polar landmark protein [Thiotrichaceae bacterium]
MYLPKVILLMVLFLYLPLSHADQTYGPLRNGETLWTIAPKVKPSDTITLHQMMVALLQANPHAFRMSCNINSLKIKQTLRIPSLTEIEKLTHKKALALYNEQNAAWKAFRKQGVKIECKEDVTDSAEIAEPTPENTLVAMNTQSAKEVVVVDDGVNLPKLSPP